MDGDARAYWAEQMEAALRLMERLLAYPVRECGEPMCCLRAAAEGAGEARMNADERR